MAAATTPATGRSAPFTPAFAAVRLIAPFRAASLGQVRRVEVPAQGRGIRSGCPRGTEMAFGIYTKRKGNEVVGEKAAPPDSTNVLDLMSALKRSLGERKQESPGDDQCAILRASTNCYQLVLGKLDHQCRSSP